MDTPQLAETVSRVIVIVIGILTGVVKLLHAIDNDKPEPPLR